jgi:hypothetical protein
MLPVWCAITATADIDLAFDAEFSTVPQGEIVAVGLFAASDSNVSQPFTAIDLVFAWDPAYLQFEGIDDSGGAPLAASFLPFPDVSGINEADPPQDGDGFYIGWAPLGSTIDAPPEGVLVTTFLFTAIAPVEATQIVILEQGGDEIIVQTRVYGAEPGEIVTGTLTPAEITIEPACPEDCAQPPDGVVDVADLLAMLSVWGEPDAFCDINGDGTVDVADLLQLLSAWGACP